MDDYESEVDFLNKRITELEKLLRGWQELLMDGAVNCGENEATEHWEKVNESLGKQ